LHSYVNGEKAASKLHNIIEVIIEPLDLFAILVAVPANDLLGVFYTIVTNCIRGRSSQMAVLLIHKFFL
jgi:hypothetical protein